MLTPNLTEKCEPDARWDDWQPSWQGFMKTAVGCAAAAGEPQQLAEEEEQMLASLAQLTHRARLPAAHRCAIHVAPLHDERTRRPLLAEEAGALINATSRATGPFEEKSLVVHAYVVRFLVTTPLRCRPE